MSEKVIGPIRTPLRWSLRATWETICCRAAVDVGRVFRTEPPPDAIHRFEGVECPACHQTYTLDLGILHDPGDPE